MLKSGAEHLRQIRDGRVIYIGAERVDDVTTHPAFRNAARSIAAIAGVSGVQYEILMLVSRAEGLAIGEVAARLHRSGAFITIESGKLVERGVLQKAADPADGRRVLLQTTRKCREILQRLAPYQVRINDVLFSHLGARQFRDLRALVREQLASGDRAVALLDVLLQEAA